MEIYFLKQAKIITVSVYIIQEMKAVTKSNWSLDVHLVP